MQAVPVRRPRRTTLSPPALWPNSAGPGAGRPDDVPIVAADAILTGTKRTVYPTVSINGIASADQGCYGVGKKRGQERGQEEGGRRRTPPRRLDAGPSRCRRHWRSRAAKASAGPLDVIERARSKPNHTCHIGVSHPSRRM